jgi:hypothetical protein
VCILLPVAKFIAEYGSPEAAFWMSGDARDVEVEVYWLLLGSCLNASCSADLDPEIVEDDDLTGKFICDPFEFALHSSLSIPLASHR